MPPLLQFYYLCHINPQKIMEQLRNFYYPDHTSTELSTGLGSSSWITDGTGNAIQHLHYLPFGEDWVDQRNSTWNAPYTFSGKEKDAETGYGYFGARYYDSGLSIWLSVDPMSDKYPSMSPYNYCANNPVILVDPDGREVDITELSKDIQDNLIKSLSALTGLKVTTKEKDGRTFLSYEMTEGDLTGSKDARDQLTSIIDNTDQKINVKESDLPDHGTYSQGNTIGIDPKQIQTMMSNVQGGLNPETMGFGMSFLHESFHTKLGGKFDENTTISKMNGIRSQLGSDFGNRMSHAFIPVRTKTGNDVYYLGFGNGMSIEIPKKDYIWKISQ